MTAWDDMRSLLPDNTDGDISAQDMRDIVTALEGEDADNIKGSSAQNIIKNPGDALDISDEIVAITDATASKRYVITLNAGEYTTKPVVMKPYVYVQGDVAGGVVVMPNAVTDTMFTMVGNSELLRLTLDGASDGIGINFVATGNCRVSEVHLEDCNYGIQVNTTGTFEGHGVSFGGTLLYGVYATAGEITLWHPEVRGQAVLSYFLSFTNTILSTVSNALSTSSNVATALECSGTSEVLFNNPGILGATTGLSVTGNTNITIKGGEFYQCDTGAILPVDAGASIVEFSGTSCTQSINYDYQLLNANASVTGLGAGDLSRSILAEGIQAVGLMVDKTEGDEGCQIFGELKVGTPLLPSETCLGEGDSYSNAENTKFYTWSGAAWADVTSDASSPSGSAITWPNLNVDTAIYMASAIEKDGDVIKIPGFKCLLTTGATTISGFPFVVEFYNGSTWEEVNSMMADASNVYESHGKNIFTETGSHQVRLDGFLKSNVTWTKSDPMSFGTALYWIRVRAQVALTQAPVIEQLKVHSNRTEINADGFVEFFGAARPVKTLPWDLGLLVATGVNPSGTHLYVSDNLDRLSIGNLFPDGTAESVGFNTFLPLDLDTSTSIRLVLSLVSNTGSATDAVFTIRWGYTSDGDNVYDSTADAPATGPNEQSTTLTVTMPGTADTQISGYVNLDVSELLPKRAAGEGDILWVSIERPTGDAHAGDISLINLQPLYASYVLGGHMA